MFGNITNMDGKGSVKKQFKVMDVSERMKHLLLYESYESFIRKCKATFNISEDSNVFFVSEEDTTTVIDCDILEKVTPEKSVLIIKIVEQAVEETSDDQPNVLEGNKEDNSEQQVESEPRETQEETDRKEYRTEQKKVGENSAEKKKKDQLSEKRTGAFDKEPSNIDYSFEECDYEEDGNEVKQHLAKHGLNNIGDVLKRHLQKWEEIPLHIAVTGASGKGKSSFINALRGLTEQDPGAAEVDVRECTKNLTPYQHPKNDNFVVWDVPGVGTKNFPKESYLEKIDIERYDFFIVVTTERFTQIDSWLLKEVKLRNKPCYILRTKIDNDIRSERRKAKKDDFDEMNAFNGLKKDLLQEMINLVNDGTEFDFFAISNHHPWKYDFPSLEGQLLRDAPPAKRRAMVFGAVGMSANVLKAKKDALRSRVWGVAVRSGAGAAIPLKLFSSTSLDVAIILEEVIFYQSQFALDDSSLAKLAEMSGVTLAEMKAEIKFNTPSILFSSDGVSQFLRKYDLDLSLNKHAANLQIPEYFLISLAWDCALFLKKTIDALTAILEMMEKDAFKVLQYVTTKGCSNHL